MSSGCDDDRFALRPLAVASRAAPAKVDFFDPAPGSIIQLQEVEPGREMVAQLSSVLSDQSRIIQDAMKHLQRLTAEFRRSFEQYASQTERMEPDQRAHSARAAANYNHVVISHWSSTERRRDRGTERRRKREKARKRYRAALTLCLCGPSFSLSLC